jgi:hypothetical protein
LYRVLAAGVKGFSGYNTMVIFYKNDD